MENIIKQASISLADTQREVVKRLLEEKRKAGLLNEAQYQDELQKTLAHLEDNAPIAKVRPQAEMTDADSFNETFNEVNIDIHTIFEQINKVDASLTKHQKLNQATINSLQFIIKRIEDEIDKYEKLLDNLDASMIYYETFRDSNNLALEPEFISERSGLALASGFRAKLDLEKEAIKLPTITSDNALVNQAGLPMATIAKVKQLGSGVTNVSNPENDITKAIDTSTETFWAENIFIDKPIAVNLGPEYYNLNFGAVCELEIVFDHLTTINEISLTPFCDYPIDIVAIRSYHSDAPDCEPYEIVSPYKTDPALRNKNSETTVAYQFPDVQAKRLRILINQPHYTKVETMFSNKEAEKLITLYGIDNPELFADPSILSALTFSPTFYDKIETIPTWMIYLRMIRQTVPEIERISKGYPELLYPIVKFQYTYGLHNISIQRNEYQPIGIYVSKPMAVKGNIKSVEIEATEEHPMLPSVDQVITNIEYYVSSKKDPGPYDWLPILPSNQTKVTAELLAPYPKDGQYVADLRFKATRILAVRKNGVKLNNYIDYEATDIAVTLLNHDGSAVYSVDYVPDESSTQVDFVDLHTVGKDTPFEKIEPNMHSVSIFGTDKNGVIELPYFPFVDRAQLNAMPQNYNPSLLSDKTNPDHYLPIRVKIVDDAGNHVEQPLDQDYVLTAINHRPRVENATDYFDTGYTTLKPFNANYPVYMYEVKGNKIRFNTTIPNNWRIVVDYPYLVGEVRVKAILRRILKEHQGLTPVLKDYTVKFRALV